MKKFIVSLLIIGMLTSLASTAMASDIVLPGDLVGITISFDGEVCVPATYFLNFDGYAEDELVEALELELIPTTIAGIMNVGITREEFAEIAVMFYNKLTGYEIPEGLENPFEDCDNYAVTVAHYIGIVAGTSETTFDPFALTNREQIFTMLYRAAKIAMPEVNFEAKSELAFDDAGEVSVYCLDAVKYLAEADLIVGYDNKLMPLDTAQCQAAVILAKRIYLGLRVEEIPVNPMEIN